MSKKPIGISCAEMMRMREPPYNMTNREIAKRLDISVPTVYKYIGGQRTYTREPETEKRESTSSNVFDTAQSLTRLGYGDRTYLVDTYKQRVELERPVNTLTPETIHRMINELTYIEELLERARKEGKEKCL